MKKTILKATNLTKQFQNNPQPVLHHINIDIYEGDFTIIMGPSGAGKSTLLYALSAMDSLSQGTVFYKNHNLHTLKEKQLSRIRNQDFGFVFQQPHLVSNLTLYENILITAYLNPNYTQKQAKQKCDNLIEMMHLQKAKDRFVNTVSGGEGQRASIARAIINQPTILFGDEPTGALNKQNSYDVLNLFSDIHEAGQSIVMVTHDIKAALRATRILYLEDGKILDELTLQPYAKQQEKQREEAISYWLSKLAW